MRDDKLKTSLFPKNDAYGKNMRDSVYEAELGAARNHMRALIDTGLNSLPGKPWSELKGDLLSRAKTSSGA